MESSAEREPYWLLAEVATWIRTRDLNQVSGIVDLNMPLAITVDTKQALKELHDCCRNGYVRSKGRRCTDSMIDRPEPVGKPLFWTSHGEGAPSDVTEIIPPDEWADLEWRPPVDGKVTGNLHWRLVRRRAWMLVQFSRSDVMREWPSQVSSNDNRPPGKMQLWQAHNRRGRKPIKRERVMQEMRRDLSQGTDLQGMREKELAKKYGVVRDTARKARNAVLSKIVDKLILDK